MNIEIIKKYNKEFYQAHEHLQYYHITDKNTNEENLLVVNHHINDIITPDDYEYLPLNSLSFSSLSTKLKVVFHLNNISVNTIQNNFFIKKLKESHKTEKINLLDNFNKIHSSVLEREFFEILFFGISDPEEFLDVLNHINPQSLNLSTFTQFKQLDNLFDIFKFSFPQKEEFWNSYFQQHKEQFSKDSYKEEAFKFLIHYPSIKIDINTSKNSDDLFLPTQEICQIIKIDFSKFNHYFERNEKNQNYFHFTEKYVNFFCLYHKIDNFIIVDEKNEKKKMSIILNHNNTQVTEDLLKKGLIFMLSDYKNLKNIQDNDFITSFKKFKIQDKLFIKNNLPLKKI